MCTFLLVTILCLAHHIQQTFTATNQPSAAATPTNVLHWKTNCSMRSLHNICLLPTSLLAVLCLLPHAKGDAWHSSLQPNEKYLPEHEQHLRHEWEIRQRMQQQVPVGVKKMTGDAEEKFFLEYWQFEPSPLDPFPIGTGDSAYFQPGNDSHPILQPPLLLHDTSPNNRLLRFLPRSLLARDFKCPGGTMACTSVGQPNTCCQTGDTCLSVQDSSVGPVGCCPAGAACNGVVAACDTAQGYTGCPNSPNGGCCIPGWACYDAGCMFGAELKRYRAY